MESGERSFRIMKLEFKSETFKNICVDLRMAITGKKVGPPLFESMEILGYEKCMKRLKRAKEYWENLTYEPEI